MRAICCEDDGCILEIKIGICAEYDMTDMMDIRELHNFLNAKITIICENIFISQMHYCQETLNTFNFLVHERTPKSLLPFYAV
jgi:hypothetical protein